MRSRIYLQTNERGFYFFKMVSGAHDYQKTVVWVNSGLVELDEKSRKFICNPKSGAEIVRTEKGALVMRPSLKGVVVYVIEEDSGYRGSCNIEVTGLGVSIMATGKAFHSPQGNLGETAWAIVNGGFGEVKVKGRRTGRRIDKEEIDYTLLPSGKKIEAVEEGLEELL